MTDHKTGTREEWLAARLGLLEDEKRWSAVATNWRASGSGCRGFASRRSTASRPKRAQRPSPTCSEDARSCSSTTLCSDPITRAGCPSCSAIADGFNGSVDPPRQSRRRILRAVSRAPLAKATGLQAADGVELPVGVFVRVGLQLRLPGVRTEASSGNLGPSNTTSARSDFRPPEAARRAVSSTNFASIDRGNGLCRPIRREAAGCQRVRARGWRGAPHVLGLCARAGRPLGHVPVARPRAARPQRGRLLVATPPEAVPRATSAVEPPGLARWYTTQSANDTRLRSTIDEANASGSRSP